MSLVLVVDDEPAVRRALERALRLDSYDVELTAIVADGPTWGVQFHPEKSQAAGLTVLAHALGVLESVG